MSSSLANTDTLPEFQYNWIEPCQLAIHLPPHSNWAPNQNFQLPPDPIKAPPQIAVPPGPVALALAPPNLPPPNHYQNQVVPPVDQPQVNQPQQQLVAGPSHLQQPTHQHDLWPRPELNYKASHVYQTKMQKTSSPGKGRSHQAGSGIILATTTSSRPIFKPRNVILTIAIL